MGTEGSHFDQLRVKLEQLRPVLTEEQHALGYLALFDEFAKEEEFELALHCVCDYLFESGTPAPKASITERIHEPHVTMQIDDDCTGRLREKDAL